MYKKYIVFVAPLLLTAVLVLPTQQQRAYSCGLDSLNSCFSGVGSGTYYEGQQDGIYDHQNGLVYNPVGQCSTCNGEDFQRGYSDGWNQYQAQNTDQRTNVNVENSPGATVNVDQTSHQNQVSDTGCGGGQDQCGNPNLCNGPCGGPTVCDFGCGGLGPWGFHHFGFWHHYGFSHEGFGPYRHIGFLHGEDQ